ncbi:MAG: hypothetical protein KBT11_08585 [Treponema sp.]|nr:hypothetical protein [Candidatus Treponema equifaecale]
MDKKAKIVLPILAGIALVYVIVAARPLLKEIQFKPEWTIDTEITTIDLNESKDFSNSVHFKLGQDLLYVSPNGEILNKISFPYKATASKNFYTVYGTSSEDFDFFTPDGKKAGKIQGTGFPYFSEDKKYLMLPGGASFVMLNEDGTHKWLFEGATPLTAFSASETGTVAGFADGTVMAFNNEGEITQQYKPGGSTYEVILGAAVSKNSEYVATLSGQDSQRFVISKRLSQSLGSNASIIFYKTMKEELNRQVLIKFSRDEKNVYYSCASGLGVVNLKTLKETIIPISGNILSILESDSGKEIFVLSRQKEKCTVSIVEGFDVLAGSFTFTAGSAAIATSESALFVGRDNKISKISIEHK